MKERPILFSGPMVRAILAGTKTQTRRVIKPQPEGLVSLDFWRAHKADSRMADPPDHAHLFGSKTGMPFYRQSPYGQAGDRLWVRESTAFYYEDGKPVRVLGRRADIPHEAWEGDGFGYDDPWWLHVKWKPSIHMPRWASRITLELTDVRVERVQDISEDDAHMEGVALKSLDIYMTWRDGFRILWDSINAKRGFGWNQNPWVWVVEFRRVDDAV